MYGFWTAMKWINYAMNNPPRCLLSGGIRPCLNVFQSSSP
jgi:hypothetical protein